MKEKRKSNSEIGSLTVESESHGFLTGQGTALSYCSCYPFDNGHINEIIKIIIIIDYRFAKILYQLQGSHLYIKEESPLSSREVGAVSWCLAVLIAAHSNLIIKERPLLCTQ